MNAHILLVMKWLNDKDSVTQDELVENRDAAYAYSAYAAAADSAAYAAADAAAAYAAAAYAAAAAEKWVNKYFDRTCENKQDYIDSLKPESKPVYTQAMCNKGVLPLVGMECFVSSDYKFNGPINANDFVTVYATENLPNENTVLIGKVDASGVYACSCHVKYLKPLTPPIELIDGKAYQFEYEGQTRYAPYRESINFFSDVDMHINPDSCTNIILLTPEVKS